MTKEEKIKEVYGCLGYVDENGWATYVIDEAFEYGIEPFGNYETRNHIDGAYEWRPIELQGIENNNGWIKIESEADLPEEDYGNYHVYSNKEIFGSEPKNQGTDDFYKDNNKIKDWLDNHTHYQPIIKPEPPIY